MIPESALGMPDRGGLRELQGRGQTNTHYRANDVSPALSLMVKPVTNVSLYASYLEAPEESGQAPANRANAGELLAPAVSKQKEIGVKAEVAQGVLLQAAYFDIKRPSTTVDSANRFGAVSRCQAVERRQCGNLRQDA